MQTALKISGIVFIIASIISMFDISILMIRLIKETCKSIINSTFDIYMFIKLIGKFSIIVISIILIIFVLLLGFQLISKY